MLGRLAALDLQDIKNAPSRVKTVQLCFEHLHLEPRKTLLDVYRQMPAFAKWGGGGIPESVEEYGASHMAMWYNASDQVMGGGERERKEKETERQMKGK